MILGSVSSDVGLTLLGSTGLLDDVELSVLRCRADVLLGTTGLLDNAGTTGLLDDVGLNVLRCRADIIRDNGPPS